jgi:hypothetical protein
MSSRRVPSARFPRFLAASIAHVTSMGRCGIPSGLRRLRVKMRRTRIEHMSSAYHPVATGEQTSRIDRFVPQPAVSKRNVIAVGILIY